MSKLDPKRLRNPAWLTVMIMVGGAILGAVIGGILTFAAMLMGKIGGGPLGVLSYSPIVMAKISIVVGLTVLATPVWALVGGWFFALKASGKGGIAKRTGVTLFSDGHPIYVRVNELAQALELPPVRWVGWYEGDEINAFASGVKQDNAMIAFTRGAVEKLSKEQFDAVMAHELAHVANYDMARMSYARSVQNALTWFLLFRGFKKVARLIFTPLSELEILRLSRSREYWADAIAATLTSPDEMIGALRAIANDAAVPPQSQRDYANLMFRANTHTWLRTHPPLEDRIKAIEERRFMKRLPFRKTESRPLTAEGASAH